MLLKHFIRYSPHSLSGTFCAYVKPLSHDFSENLTQNNKIVMTQPPFKSLDNRTCGGLAGAVGMAFAFQPHT